MARIRSPNYPAMSLPEAISRVGVIHSKEQHLAAPKEVIARHLGYASLNGSALKAISALLKYGLLDEAIGGKMKVSDLALSILHPRSPTEKGAAIKDAAGRPALFVEISNEWEGGIPSDANLKSYLIRRNFAADAIDRVIKSYRETVELVARESGGYDPVPEAMEPIMEQSSVPAIAGRNAQPSPQAPLSALTVTMSDDTELNRPQIVNLGAEIQFSGRVNRKGLDRLIKKLEAYRAVLDAAEDEEEENDV